MLLMSLRSFTMEIDMHRDEAIKTAMGLIMLIVTTWLLLHI